MEPDFREIGLCHLQYITRIGQKHIAPLLVESHKLVFPFFKCL